MKIGGASPAMGQGVGAEVWDRGKEQMRATVVIQWTPEGIVALVYCDGVIYKKTFRHAVYMTEELIMYFWDKHRGDFIVDDAPDPNLVKWLRWREAETLCTNCRNGEGSST